ncbi:MAG TPA: hypothetical protein VNI54_17445 [Thermoanaerobaculia bacterium]|nr:hypothetical protein [Thermoanaerobaculia bacterium]
MTVATVLALLLLPLVILRRRTLAAYYGTIAAIWLFATIVWQRVPLFEWTFVAVTVISFAALALFIAAGEHVRWSVNRAALIAAVVYALAIPRMLDAPIDGDEPFYLLQTASLTADFDLDLANQYANRTAAKWGRDNITEPQVGDPRGEHGELYSRHEPFLAVLMVPGYALFGIHGAVATVALFGVLLVRSTLRWMEDEGVSEEAARGVFAFFAFAPPVLFYATRIWPEVPAAFFFVEALRGMRERRSKRWLPALLGLVLLKLRFVLVAAGVVVRRKIAIPILILPLLVIWFITGDADNVHTWRELIPMNPMRYLVGLGGLLADGMSGIAFQAPFYLFALYAILRRKKTPHGFRAGLLASLLYLFYLVPRGEWFGGWAPPLRYIVFLMPVLALGIASVWKEISRGAIALVAAWSAGLVIYGLTYPWRLFHEFTGENAIGEWLSQTYESDFSRLFPSFIRLNEAAWWGVGAIVVVACGAAVIGRIGPIGPIGPIAVFALALALAFNAGTRPARVVEFEDTHVRRISGRIYPNPYTLMRATYRQGWVLDAGQEISFLAKAGTHDLDFITGLGGAFELAGRTYTVRPDVRYQRIAVTIPSDGRLTLRCLTGGINLDRMERR